MNLAHAPPASSTPELFLGLDEVDPDVPLATLFAAVPSIDVWAALDVAGLAHTPTNAPAPAVLSVQSMASKRATPQAVATSWDELALQFSTVRRTHLAKSDLPAWVPATLIKQGERKAANVATVDPLVLDIDHATREQFAEVRKRMDSCGLEYVYHSTYSYDPLKHDGFNYRVIICLSRPVPATHWKAFRAECISTFGASGAADPQTSDPSRLYFLPFAPDDGPEPDAGHVRGRALDVDLILAAIERRATLAPAAPVPTAAPAPAVDVLARVHAPTRDTIEQACKRLSTARREDKREAHDLFARMLAGEALAPAGEQKRHDAALRATRLLVEWFPAIEWPLVAELVKPAYPDDWYQCEREVRDAYEGALAKFSPIAADETRRAIYLTDDFAVAEQASIEALATHPDLFVFQRQLAVIHSTGAATALGVHSLRSELSRVAKFVIKRGTGDEVKWTAIEPPEDIARAILERGAWPGLREVTAIHRHPVLLPGWRTYAGPGYDAESQTYYAPRRAYELPPAAPTREQAREALDRLQAPYLDYVAGDRGDPRLAVLVSAELTGIARPAILGPIPATAIDGDGNDLGKTTAADKVAASHLGERARKLAYTKRRDELAKQLLPLIDAGQAAVVLDNVPPDAKAGDGSELCVVLTSYPEYSDRPLGTSSIISPRNVTHFLLTGSKLQLASDGFPRRVNYARFDRSLHGIEDRYDVDWIVDHHAERVRDALTVLLAYHAAGEPAQQMLWWSSFDKWSALVRAPLIWLGMSDPRQTSKALRGADAEPYGAVVHALHARFGGEPWRAEVLQHELPSSDLSLALGLCGWPGESKNKVIALGKLLKDMSYEWFDGLRLVKAAPKNGYPHWKIEKQT